MQRLIVRNRVNDLEVCKPIFDEELSYELMGEFFLSGILETGTSDR